ncbi:Peptide deformylase [Candidatus Rubidus massiliensis]|nr:MAG: peptide deformylase [Chlamydia sp. 32-24]CDZ80605.1 Peptide deformylase [Candidatus Rubidus massiliensis]
MILKLAYYGNPILRKKGQLIENVTDEIKQLVFDMFETMYHYDGIGIAAPQVHHSLSLFVMCVPKVISEDQVEKGTERVFINPKILEYDQKTWLRGEGCLSIPKVYGEVERPISIKVEAMDLNGNIFTETFYDLEARCIMHEKDHVDGKLFIDRIHGKQRKEMEPYLQTIKKKYKDF